MTFKHSKNITNRFNSITDDNENFWEFNETKNELETINNVNIDGNLAVSNSTSISGNSSISGDIYISGIIHNSDLDRRFSQCCGDTGTENTQTLEETLSNGNSAGSYNIDMNNQSIEKINQLSFQNEIILQRKGETYLKSSSVNGISLGLESGYMNQGTGSIAIGTNAGRKNQGQNAITMGVQSGNGQGDCSIAIGCYAGNTGQQDNCIAIGNLTGTELQGTGSIAIGSGAGSIGQGPSSVAIGYGAGAGAQKEYAVAIGFAAGAFGQGTGSVSIGPNTGINTQGEYSIAIGNGAGNPNQSKRSIVFNANEDTLATSEEGFYVNPIRNKQGLHPLVYDTSSKEITYDTTSKTIKLIDEDEDAQILYINADVNILGDLCVPNHYMQNRFLILPVSTGYLDVFDDTLFKIPKNIPTTLFIKNEWIVKYNPDFSPPTKSTVSNWVSLDESTGVFEFNLPGYYHYKSNFACTIQTTDPSFVQTWVSMGPDKNELQNTRTLVQDYYHPDSSSNPEYRIHHFATDSIIYVDSDYLPYYFTQYIETNTDAILGKLTSYKKEYMYQTFFKYA